MESAVVELEVGEETCFFIGAIRLDEGAFIFYFGGVDKAALEQKACQLLFLPEIPPT